MQKFNSSILIIVLIIIILLYDLLRTILSRLKKKVVDYSSTKINKSRSKIFDYLSRMSGMLETYLYNLNINKRKTNLLYLYYHKMTVLIEILGLREYTNVFSIFLLIIVVSLITSVILTVGLNPWLTLILFFVLVITYHLLLFFFSLSKNLDRVIDVMKAEDKLCTSMEDGIIKAVDKNIKEIPESIRYIFEDFVYSSRKMGEPVSKTLTVLNSRVGKGLNDFCELALQHYTTGNQELIQAFRENIKKNSKRRISITHLRENYKVNVFFYLIGVGVTIGFTIACLSIMGVTFTWFLTARGRTFSIFAIISAIVGFVLGQLIYSRGVD